MNKQRTLKVIIVPANTFRYEPVLLAIAHALDNGQQTIISSPTNDHGHELHASLCLAPVAAALVASRSGGATRSETARRFHAGEFSVMIVTISDRLAKLWADGQRMEKVDLETFAYATSLHSETLRRRLALGEIRFREWIPRIAPTYPAISVTDIGAAIQALSAQSPTSAGVAITRLRNMRDSC